MQNFKQKAVFAAVADAGSFTAAAQRLGIAKSAVSRYVSELEDELGVILLQRTTRRLSLTEAGARYHEYCARMVAEADAADESVSDLRSEPTGKLRISAPFNFGSDFVLPILIEFAARYPQLEVDFNLDLRAVDLIEQGYDMAIRIGELPDSSLMARKLATCRTIICGSPEYFAAHGIPDSPRALVDHKWIPINPVSERLVFRHGERSQTVTLKGRFSTNNADALMVLLRTGQGLAQFPLWLALKDLEAGTLKVALADYSTGDLGVFAIYPSAKHILPRVRLFIDELVAKCGQHDWTRIDPNWLAA